MEAITLITPTSDRPQAFALCERWMCRQTYAGEIRWIVVDDGEAPVCCTLGQTHLRRAASTDRVASFRGNLLAGLAQVETPLVAIIEDDDWYHPRWLDALVRSLAGRDLYGEGRAKYYHVPTRRHCQHDNTQHASLCQTGFRADLIPWLSTQIETRDSKFIDLRLWRHAPTDLKQVAPQSRHAVGIKGLPGRAGLGMGHRLGEQHPVDQDGSVLRSWIGADAEIYFHLPGVTR